MTVGLVAFVIGAWYIGTHVPHVHDRVEAWLHPLDAQLYSKVGGSYQLANSMFAQAAGGLFGQGFGEAALNIPGGGPLLPAPQTDMIYAVITDELGLFGACAVLITYLLFVARGLKTAQLARDSFSTLLAVGAQRDLRAAGVRDRGRSDTRDPADRRDAAVHLLRRLVDHRQLRAAGAAAARLRPSQEGCVNVPIARLFGAIVVLFALLIVWTSRWTVFEASSLNNDVLNRRTLIDQLKIKRGRIIADDGTVLARSVPGREAPTRASIPPATCSPRRSATRSPPRAAAPGSSGRAATRCVACRRA